MRFLLVLISLSLVFFTNALVIVDSALASACIYYMKGFNWGCGGTGQGHAVYSCRCANVDWLGSVSSCMVSQASSQGETEHAWAHVALRCRQKGPYDYHASDMKKWAQNASSYLQMPAANDTKVQVRHPLAVNVTAFAYYDRSFKQINHHVFKSQWLGWGLLFFWVALISVYTVANFMWTYFRVNIYGSRVSQIYQKYFSQTTFIFGLTRWNLLIFTLFTIQSVLSTALSYKVQLPNAYINNHYLLTLDLIGYRSAIISFSLLPVVFIFGLRNNPFCWLTGLSQAEFISYHKVVAIIMSLEALIHSSVWTAYAIRSGPYPTWSMDDYWRWGIVGTVLVFLMLGQSIKVIRNLMYETFVMVHKIFGWLFIVSMWYHCDILGWMGWVYSMIALTAYDRLLRFFKIFVVNRGYTNITVTVVDDKVLKVTIPKPVSYDVAYKPGCHIYLSFYHWSIWYQCFQSHPFTVVSSPVVSSDVLTVYVRIKKGTTRALSKLKTNEKGNVSLWALIDGPYGHGAPSFRESDTVVGMAAGVGLCGILPSLYNCPPKTKLFWVVNNHNEVGLLSKDLDYLIKKGAEVKVLLTNADETLDVVLLEKTYPYLSVAESRPGMDQWVSEAIEFAKANSSSDLFVVSCGPRSMESNVANSIAKKVEVGLSLVIHHQLELAVW